MFARPRIMSQDTPVCFSFLSLARVLYDLIFNGAVLTRIVLPSRRLPSSHLTNSPTFSVLSSTAYLISRSSSPARRRRRSVCELRELSIRLYELNPEERLHMVYAHPSATSLHPFSPLPPPPFLYRRPSCTPFLYVRNSIRPYVEENTLYPDGYLGR